MDCAAHRYHSPRPQKLEEHHVVPLAWGGSKTADNQVAVCATGHRNIHTLLDEYVHARGLPRWELRRQFGFGERRLAAAAWNAAATNPELHPVLTS